MDWKRLLYKDKPAQPPVIQGEESFAAPGSQELAKANGLHPDILDKGSWGDLSGQQAYEEIHARTDFAKTPAGQTLGRYMDALEGVIADPELRLKAALAQAVKLDSSLLGKDPIATILGAFDGMLQGLNDYQGQFEEEHSQRVQSEVTARETRSREIETELKELQSKVSELNREYAQLAADQGMAVKQLASEESATKHAIEHRKGEIAKERQKFATLLGL